MRLARKRIDGEVLFCFQLLVGHIAPDGKRPQAVAGWFDPALRLRFR
jgi:hypothetical protein